jgi:hypothetical protein
MFPLFNRQEVLVVCQNRVNKLKELVSQAEQEAQMMGTPPDLEAIVGQLKLFPFEENHQIKAQILSRYLDDDEVQQEWSETMVAAVQLLISKHFEFDSNIQGQVMIAAAANQGKAQGEAMGQAAMRQAEITAPLMQAQASAQAEAEAAAQEQAAVQEGYMKAADLAAEEEAFSRDQEAADKDMQRQDVLAQREYTRERVAAAEDHKRALEIKKYERATANSGASSRPKRKR